MVFAIAIWAIFKCLIFSTKKKCHVLFSSFSRFLTPKISPGNLGHLQMFAFLAKKKRPLRCLVNKSGGSSLGASPPPLPPQGSSREPPRPHVASQASREPPQPPSLPPPAPPSESRQGASESRPPEPCSEEQVHGKEGLNLQPARMQPARMQPVSANATATPPQLVEESLQALPRDEGPTHIFYAHVLQRF